MLTTPEDSVMSWMVSWSSWKVSISTLTESFCLLFSLVTRLAIDKATGALRVNIPAFSPANAIAYPEGATHVRFVSGGASINFEAGTFEAATSQSADIAIGEAPVAAVELLTNWQQTALWIPDCNLAIMFGVF